MVTRRRFLGAVGSGAMAAVVLPLRAQQEQNTGAANVPMEQGAYRPVQLAAKSSTPSMTDAKRDELEHSLHCMCGCNLDVYTCRTTDFSCQVSPAMHHDVQALVAGGYSGAEILNAFTGVYGEQVLMAPTKQGFNWTGYLTPFFALGGGTALVIALLRRWHRVPAPAPVSSVLPTRATPEEMAKLDAALRRDDD